jgi:phenylacetate-coenzyme A ligase PaaK-like adenylate-forming protein
MLSGIGAGVSALLEGLATARLNNREFRIRQLKKFRKLARHAGRHSSYYTGIIRDSSIDLETCTPEDFPVLTKSLLMENFDRVVTDPAVTRQGVTDFLARSKDPAEKFLGRYRVMHTSGTSGEVGYFLYSDADWARGMMGVAFRRRRRLPPLHSRTNRGRFRFAFYGATGGHFAGVTMATAASRGIARLFATVRTFEINAPMQQTLDSLNEFQPDILSGYTAALRMLGEKQKEGALRISPMYIAATGETVTRADMAFLSEAFNAVVASAYGCTEHLGVGASDPDGETMTLNDNSLIFEFRADHSLFTNLFNYTMPLIRYRMSDILIPVEQPKDAPHRLVIRNLVGRTEKVPTFVNRDGAKDFISPHTINEIFVPDVMRFQLRLTGPSSFRFLACLAPGLDAIRREAALAGLKARLEEILAQKGMPNVQFEISIVDQLPVDPRTRKFRLIVDDQAAGAPTETAASPA